MSPPRNAPAALAIAAALAIDAPSVAQQRPAIPEVRCTPVTLTATVRASGASRSVALRVTNDDAGDFPAQIGAEVVVEREVNGAWRRAGVAGMRLRSDCRSAVAACVTIAPRSSIDVAPWQGTLGDGQCGCERCVSAPPGRYRFVVTTCQSCFQPRESVSEPFTLPAEGPRGASRSARGGR